jgi:cleavage and polyadenylation specificity factor subunit 2
VLESFTRPTVLISDAYNALVEHPPRRQRDTQLLESIMSTLKGGGNVLLPADTAGRVLELLLIIHSYWEYNSFGKSNFPLVFLANESYYTVDFARSMIEWMSTQCMYCIQCWHRSTNLID